MKQFGGAGSAVLLIAAFLVASNLAKECESDNEIQVGEKADELSPAEKKQARKLVRVVLAEYSLAHDDLTLNLKRLTSIEKYPILCSKKFTTKYVVRGTFSREEASDMTCKMSLYAGQPVNNIESIMDCQILRKYTIDIALANVEVKERPAVK